MNDDIIPVDSYDFDERIEKGIVMVDFYAEWCVHSKGIEPIIEEIADEYYDSIRVLALDVEQSPDIAMHYEIETTPTIIIFKDGKIAHRITGANPPSTYSDALDELL
ncbi:MAG: thioredoxin family protein [Acutalibacteraceae bacterium]